jgi:hypothetical protein
MYRIESGEETVGVLDLSTHPGGQLVHQGKEFVALQLLGTLLQGQFSQYITSYKGGNFFAFPNAIIVLKSFLRCFSIHAGSCNF